jgi:hypothetical protein
VDEQQAATGAMRPAESGVARTPASAAVPAFAGAPVLATVPAEPDGRFPGEWPWSVEALRAAGPGAELAWELETGDPEASSDDALLEAVLAFQRLAYWAAAHGARAAAALSQRESMNPAWPASAGHVTVTDVTAEELAPALGCSRRAARRLVTDGLAWSGVLAATGDALARGEIDAHRARVITDALADQPVGLAWAVQDEVLPGAAGRSPAQLARDVARALLAVDPAGSAARVRAAESRRRVDRPRFLPDGMAGLWAVLPAADATRVEATIDALARGGRACGDPRTLDQLRADLLVDLVLGRVDDASDLGGSACRGSGAAGAMGPCGDSAAEETADAVPGAASVGAAGEQRARSPRARPPRARVSVTVGWDVLAGMSEDPGYLDGYGPIPASVARDLAADGVWRRLLTDPASGAVLDVGRTRYRPPAELAEHVRARDRWCARPGCSAHAESCDLDHTAEWDRDGGRTAHDNLGPLCPRDHQVKTHGGFRLRQRTPGVFEWSTPLGRRYVVRPGLDGPYVVPRRGRASDGGGVAPPY